MSLPVITSSERMDYKRCPKRWFWKWRQGLVPRMHWFGALDLGTWMHDGFEAWYQPGYRRAGDLHVHVEHFAETALREKQAISTEESQQTGEELMSLAVEMAKHYQKFYGRDRNLFILATEIPLEFSFGHPSLPPEQVVAQHKIKPDAVFRDRFGDIWLLEHKTAKQVMLEHLVIDDQARPYGAMAEALLRRAGLIPRHADFKGILYNFARKALPDLRPRNEKGQYLNKDETVSKRQPSPFFVRKPVVMTKKSKILTLERVAEETREITEISLALRNKKISSRKLKKTPHKSCVKTCPFFSMCVAEEEGTDIRDMRKALYRRVDPYAYHRTSTEDQAGFEIA